MDEFREWLNGEVEKARFALDHQTFEMLTLHIHTERVRTLEKVKAELDRLVPEVGSEGDE